MRYAALFPLLLLFAATATAARADALVLEDGRTLKDVRVEVRPNAYLVSFEHGVVALEKKTVRYHFGAEDAAGPRMVDSIRKRKHWRSRHRHTSPCFRYETTVPEFAFVRYRKAMDGHAQMLQRVFGLEDEEGGGPTVCLYRDREKFTMIGGVSPVCQGYFRRVEPIELAFYDDVLQREVSLRVGRWLAAGYVLSRAYPKLGTKTFLTPALTDYYGAAIEVPDAPGTMKGLAYGTHWESLHEDRRRDPSVDLSRLTKGHAQFRLAWGWALVHFLMETERYAEPFRRFLGEAEGASTEADLAALESALGLDDPVVRRTFLAAWKAHLDALAPSTRIDHLLAGEIAEHHDRGVRAAAHYKKAGGNPGAALARAVREVELARIGMDDAGEIEGLSRLLDLDPLDFEARRMRAALIRATNGGTGVERELALTQEIATALGESRGGT